MRWGSSAERESSVVLNRVCEITDMVLSGALSILLQTECIEAVVLSGAGRRAEAECHFSARWKQHTDQRLMLGDRAHRPYRSVILHSI